MFHDLFEPHCYDLNLFQKEIKFRHLFVRYLVQRKCIVLKPLFVGHISEKQSSQKVSTQTKLMKAIISSTMFCRKVKRKEELQMCWFFKVVPISTHENSCFENYRIIFRKTLCCSNCLVNYKLIAHNFPNSGFNKECFSGIFRKEVFWNTPWNTPNQLFLR